MAQSSSSFSFDAVRVFPLPAHREPPPNLCARSRPSPRSGVRVLQLTHTPVGGSTQLEVRDQRGRIDRNELQGLAVGTELGRDECIGALGGEDRNFGAIALEGSAGAEDLPNL